MARKSQPDAVIRNNTNDDALNSAANSAVTLGTQYQVISAQFGYHLAYNRDRMVDEVRHYMGESARTMLEAGARLALIRSQEPHGEWDDVCQSLNLERRTANRMIAAASKFSNGTTSSQLEQLGTSKMFELLLLDDDDADLLVNGGAVEGLGSADDIAKMTVKELRGALRDMREDSKAKDAVLAKKSELIDKLQTKQAKLKPPTPDEQCGQLRREISDWAHHAEAIIRGTMRDGIEQLFHHALENGGNHDEFVAGVVAQLDRALTELRGTLLIKSAPDADPTPEWAKD